MKSTINFALSNAFAKLNLSDTFRDQTIAHLWRSIDPPAPAPAPLTNLEKLNRQQIQRLTQLAADEDDPRDEKQIHKDFLAYVNRIPADTFKSLSLVDHMMHFLNPMASNAAAAPAPVDDDDEDVVDVSFHLREYVVGIKTHRVYELRGGVHVFVGMLGMNEFAGMIMPEIEDE
jgi:hypothetical protein